jgi:hypothetical protein
MIQALESRRLLSSGITVTHSGDALDIKGGADGSVINVVETNHNVIVEDGGVQVFSGSGINSIKITGQAQHDQIFYTGDSVGAQIGAGGGADEITVNDRGTAGSYASGDGGDDDLVVLDANNTTLVGDGGGDTLYVSDNVGIDKDVHLYGLGGSDFINIAGGRNFVHGGGGRDTMVTNGVEGVDYVLVVVDSVETTASI